MQPISAAVDGNPFSKEMGKLIETKGGGIKKAIKCKGSEKRLGTYTFA